MSENAVPIDLDSHGHRPGCPHYGEDDGAPLADETSHHVDLFCDCHDWARPRVLGDGTDIAWPGGWNQEMAAEWRAKNGLAAPSEPGSGP